MAPRNWMLGLVILGVVAAGTAYWMAQSPSVGMKQGASSPNPYSARNPKAAPEITLKDSEGKIRKLADLKGNLVLVHFWASWCPPCVPEFPEFLAFAERHKDQKVKALAISVDDKWDDALKMIPSTLPANTWVLWDKEAKVPDAYGTYQYPETYLLDGDLRIIYKWVGPQDWKGPAVEHLLESALKFLESGQAESPQEPGAPSG